jgi:hypothetical protein
MTAADGIMKQKNGTGKKEFLTAGGVMMSVLLAAMIPAPAPAVGKDAGQLCTLSMQMDSPDRCAPDGIAAQRAMYWEEGLLPRQTFSALPIDASLGRVNRDYYVASKSSRLSLYATRQDAVDDRPVLHLEQGLVYIAAQAHEIQNGTKLIYTGNSYWARTNDLSPIYTQVNQFHGVEFPQTPSHRFGWVLYAKGVRPARDPGGSPDLHAPFYAWRAMVEAFDSQTVRGVVWYEIGLGQWISQEEIRVVTIPTALPEGVPSNTRWIRIDLDQQTVAAFEGMNMVFASQTSTGIQPYFTRPGVFQISKKLPLQNMSGSFATDRSDYYFVGDVPWVMYFDRARALHGAYWHNNFGFPRSHGCVNLSDADAHWLYNWADTGTWVQVIDPSGKTPTDDNYYKDDAGAV